MTLVAARSLEEYLDESDEFGASSVREARRAYRQARRRNRRVEKKHELENKTRSLNQETRQVRRASRREAHQPAKPSERSSDPAGGRNLERSRDFPRTLSPGRGPVPPPRGPFPGRAARQGQDAWRAGPAPEPPDEAPPEPDDWSEPAGFEEEPLPEDFPEDFPEEMPEEAIAGRLRGRDPGWGAPVEASPRVRVQARRGHRAGVLELEPGLYLVSEFPEASEFGVVPVLATLMVRSATRALSNPAPTEAAPAEPKRRPLADLFRRRQPVPAAPAAPPTPSTSLVPVAAPLPSLGWLHPDDAADLFGCPTCRRR